MEEIITLITNHETDRVRELLDAGCFSDMLTEDGHTPLYWAVIAQSVEIAELIMQKGMDVNTQDDNGETALHLAVGNDDIDIVKALIEHNADVNSISENGESGTPLHHVVSREIAEYLLSRGADVDTQDSYGHTPLHEAVTEGNVDVVSTLIDHGADINVRSHSGWTPLHWAVWGRRKSVVRLLLSKGADVNARVLGYGCTTGWTPSYWTSTSSFLKDADETKVKTGWTPLHLAAIQGDAGIVRVLLSEGADPNIAADSLCTPLHWARLMKKDNAAEILIAHGGVDLCT